MADNTSIEWARHPVTGRGASWNPVLVRRRDTGKLGYHCEHASPGCINCYSETFNRRGLPNRGTGLSFKPGHRGEVEIICHEPALLQPLRWRQPRGIFVCSMTDLFGEFVPDEIIDKVFAVAALCPQHIFMVLTKRAARMRDYFRGDPLARVKSAIESHGNNVPGDDMEDFEFFAGMGWTARTEGCRPECRVPCCLVWNEDGTKTIAAQLFDGSASRPAGKCYGKIRWDGPVAWPLPNAWIGVSVEDQRRADERIPDLLATPAAIRFVSAEPLLGPLDLYGGDPDPRLGGVKAGPGLSLGQWWAPGDGPKAPPRPGVDWVIAGGESGPGARPMLRAWARSLHDQCAAAGIPFFFKQWGEWIDADEWLDHIEAGPSQLFLDGVRWSPPRPLNFADVAHLAGFTNRKRFEHQSDGTTMIRVGKSAAGRMLDGREYNEMPSPDQALVSLSPAQPAGGGTAPELRRSEGGVGG